MTMSTPLPASAATAPQTGGDRPLLLEARNISKYFGAVVALEGVSLEVRAGEINCLLGDNGAGKSTLIKTLSGVHAPDDGTLAVDGTPVRFNAPRDALDAGIATVYQDLSVMPLMSISRNFFLGNEPTKGVGPFKWFDSDKAAQVARDEMHNIGIDVRDTDQLVGTLSGGERQTLAIARAEYFGARVLILDEPTSAIDSMTESVILDALDRLMVGRTTFVIAHRLSTVRHADQILVMDGGCIVQRGGHDELLKLGGLYRQLHEAQQGSHRAAARVAAVGGLTPTPLARTNGSGRNPQDGRVGEAELKAELERMLARSVNGNASPASLPTAAALLLRAAAEDLRENGNWAALRSLTRLRPSPLEELRIAAELAHTLLHELGLAAEPPGAGAVGAEGRAEIVRRLAPALRHASEEVLL